MPSNTCASPKLQPPLEMKQNPYWGAPRIHGELLMLGFDASERTIANRVEVNVNLKWKRIWPALTTFRCSQLRNSTGDADGD